MSKKMPMKPMKVPKGGIHVLVVGFIGSRTKPEPRRDRRAPGPQPRRRTT